MTAATELMKKLLIKNHLFTTTSLTKNKIPSCFYMATALHLVLKPHTTPTGC